MGTHKNSVGIPTMPFISQGPSLSTIVHKGLVAKDRVLPTHPPTQFCVCGSFCFLPLLLLQDCLLVFYPPRHLPDAAARLKGKKN